MVDDNHPEVQKFIREIEKTFWLRFLIKCALTMTAGFLATLIILPLTATLYGWAMHPTIVYKTVVARSTKGCMQGQSATVVSTSYEGDSSVITLRQGYDPTFICRFNHDQLRLYYSWRRGDTVYHDGGEQL